MGFWKLLKYMSFNIKNHLKQGDLAECLMKNERVSGQFGTTLCLPRKIPGWSMTNRYSLNIVGNFFSYPYITIHRLSQKIFLSLLFFIYIFCWGFF